MPIALTASDIVAGLALLLSAYATWKTVQFNKRQQSLIESQKMLNQRLLEKEDAESAEEKKADLNAAFIRLGSNRYRFKIWNQGRATARNVSLDFPERNDFLIPDDINSKFPMERLDRYQSVELIASVHLGTKSKHAIKLCWADDFSDKNEKVVYPTL